MLAPSTQVKSNSSSFEQRNRSLDHPRWLASTAARLPSSCLCVSSQGDRMGGSSDLCHSRDLIMIATRKRSVERVTDARCHSLCT